MRQGLLQVELFFALMQLSYVAGEYCFSSLVSTSGSFIPHILNIFGIEEGEGSVKELNSKRGDSTNKTMHQTDNISSNYMQIMLRRTADHTPVENGPRGLQTSNLPHHHAPRIRSWRYPRCQLDLPTPTNAISTNVKKPTWR
jgi:hypothetical protein